MPTHVHCWKAAQSSPIEFSRTISDFAPSLLGSSRVASATVIIFAPDISRISESLRASGARPQRAKVTRAVDACAGTCSRKKMLGLPKLDQGHPSTRFLRDGQSAGKSTVRAMDGRRGHNLIEFSSRVRRKTHRGRDRRFTWSDIIERPIEMAQYLRALCHRFARRTYCGALLARKLTWDSRRGRHSTTQRLVTGTDQGRLRSAPALLLGNGSSGQLHDVFTTLGRSAESRSEWTPSVSSSASSAPRAASQRQKR
jgi:hypothetical protein